MCKTLANVTKVCSICWTCLGQMKNRRNWRKPCQGKKECDLEKASRLYKAKTGAGCDGFHPKVLLCFTTKTRVNVVELLKKVEDGRNKFARRCSFCPKNVTSERPIALMPTLTRWWEAKVMWQQWYRVEWDAVDGRNGGAQETVWEILLEIHQDVLSQCAIKHGVKLVLHESDDLQASVDLFGV